MTVVPMWRSIGGRAMIYRLEANIGRQCTQEGQVFWERIRLGYGYEKEGRNGACLTCVYGQVLSKISTS